MADIAVIGCGHVGLVTAACFAKLGHNVECIDIDERRVAALQRGECPIHEPGLAELLREGAEAGRLQFMATYPERLRASIVFVAANTPSSQEGAADLRAVREAVGTVAARLRSGAIIVNKSTVPIGTGDLVEGIARRSGGRGISVVSNPEFLREGSAVHDFLRPDRVVLGSNDAAALERVAALYAPFNGPILRTDIRTAEMIKYASNAFLSTKISFINEMASICEALGADVREVARGMGMDQRIGEQFLNAGLGWGGSCFPKDVAALVHMAAVHGTHPQLLRSVVDINNGQRLRTIRKLRDALGTLEGRRVLILGAAFKPHTDDLRNSPALDLAALLHLEGAQVAIYDPIVAPDRIAQALPQVEVALSPIEGATGAHAILIATDWPQFRSLPLASIGEVVAERLIIDARNTLDPAVVRAAGFTYRCIGRPATETQLAAPTAERAAAAVAAGVGS